VEQAQTINLFLCMDERIFGKMMIRKSLYVISIYVLLGQVRKLLFEQEVSFLGEA
jgi:hypothetical protein